MKRFRQCWQRIRTTPRVSPCGFLLYAVVFVILYALWHLMGLRESASVACGTPQRLLGSEMLGGGFGVAYILLYLMAVVAAPILVVAAGLWAVGGIALGSRRRRAGARENSPNVPQIADRPTGGE